MCLQVCVCACGAQLAHDEAEELLRMLQERSARVVQLEQCLAALGAAMPSAALYCRITTKLERVSVADA